MPSVPPAERVFSPLDEELELLPGGLTPSLVESMVRLASWMPFARAGEMLAHFTKVEVSPTTIGRITEMAGGAYVQLQEAEVAAIEKELPRSPAGPELQQVSVDGAMVPLVRKEWAEVKTLAIGEVERPVLERGEWVVHTRDLSYFSRLLDHESFARLATVETHRRGVENAGLVCAVVDGAEWEQKFIDLHCPGAVRILDWAHAAEHIAKAGQAIFGVGTAAAQWLGVQLHELKHSDPEKLLGKLRGLREELAAQGGRGESQEAVRSALEYLEKRREQIRYSEFRAAGYPIGSGIVESANKLVVEQRLKGAGMHWARANVNPMVGLRTIACSNRWEEAWPQISERLCRRRSLRQRTKAQALEGQTVALAKVLSEQEIPKGESNSNLSPVEPKRAYKAANRGHKPTPGHPWRHMPVGRRRPIQPSS